METLATHRVRGGREGKQSSVIRDNFSNDFSTTSNVMLSVMLNTLQTHCHIVCLFVESRC